MPQLDILIFSTQVSFVFLFWIGYFIFIKTILPIVSMEMKLRSKRLLSNLIWFKQNLNNVLFFRLPLGKLLVKTRGMLNSVDNIFAKRKVFFGIYQQDLLLLKRKKKI
jgi:hypothetical protein